MKLSHRLTTRIDGWVEESIERHALGDEITWDCSFAMTPEGPKMLVVFFTPGAILGTMVQAVSIVENVVAASAEDVDGMVRNCLEDLRQNRSKQMTEPLDAVNGSPN